MSPLVLCLLLLVMLTGGAGVAVALERGDPASLLFGVQNSLAALLAVALVGGDE